MEKFFMSFRMFTKLSSDSQQTLSVLALKSILLGWEGNG